MGSASIDALPPLREVIAKHGLLARKALGQHFLFDLNLTRRIAECAGDLKGQTVIEVGPGPGGLTRALLNTEARQVIVIEKDRRCLPALQEIEAVAGGRLRIIEGDALETDYLALGPGPRSVVANLPYNIGTELLIHWLRQIDAFESLTLMFQTEVALRITAAPDSKTYGRLSVIAQLCADPREVLEIPARAFTPPPKVSSSVVHFRPRRLPPDVTLEEIEAITAAAFGQRRKMLRSSLRPLGGEELLRRAGIDPEFRAENLSTAAFIDLARAFRKRI